MSSTGTGIVPGPERTDQKAYMEYTRHFNDYLAAWRSFKQLCAAESSKEAEYISIMERI